MILVDMQHSHPHITLYQDITFLVGVEQYFVMLNY